MSIKNKVQDLSFVKSTSQKREFWVSHPLSDFSASFEIGKQMAIEYLFYINSPNSAPILASIVIDAARQSTSIHHNEAQLIGFFTTLESVVKAKLADK